MKNFISPSETRCSQVQFGTENQFPMTSLSSYPGSGNTWVRYLIEEYTGYYTGSIYSDMNLFKGGFKGEMEDWKDGKTIVIKAHSKGLKILNSTDSLPPPHGKTVISIRTTL